MKQLDEREAEVQASYGTMSIEAFDEARKVIADATSAFERRRPTFREDYEITDAETGMVTVSYRGECQVCHLSLAFTTEHPIPDWDKP